MWSEVRYDVKCWFGKIWQRQSNRRFFQILAADHCLQFLNLKICLHTCPREGVYAIWSMYTYNLWWEVYVYIYRDRNVRKTNLGVLDMKRLLFLCNRGIVSGPMAKALFQHMGPSLLLNWEVTDVICLCYDNNKGVGTMTILFVMLMIQWLWWWISVIITRKRSMLQPHILDITKSQIHVAMGIQLS